MNYFQLYQNIIENAKTRKSPPNDFEEHHILPKSLGGSNSFNNLVKLTFREHYLSHFLLTKIYPDSIKMYYAFHLMNNRGKYTNSRLYEKFRSRFKRKYRGKCHYLYGIKRTEESRKKQSNAISGKQNHFYGKQHNATSKEKMAMAKKNKPRSIKIREKMSNGLYITPFGSFFSILEAERHGCLSNNVILRYCKNPQKTISKQMVGKSSYLSKDMIGKSLKDIGFYFVRK